MVSRTAPPPLAPMSKETTPMSNNQKAQKLDLGSALAALGGTNRARNKKNIFLDEPMEEGLGAGQFDGDVLSVQEDPRRGPREKRPSLPVQASPSQRGQPRRSSLIERSMQFQDKLVKFMQDYSTHTGIEDVDIEEGMEEGMAENHANDFPTRETDLRHVDQRVNLMNASLKRQDYYDDEEEDEYYDEDEDDVYANYTEGYTENLDPSERPQRKPSVPPKKMFDQEAIEDESQLKKYSPWERYRSPIRWVILILLFVATATWLLMVFNFFTNNPSVGYNQATMSPAGTALVPHQPELAPSAPGATPGEIYERKHDLQVILEKELFPQARQDVDLVRDGPFAKKTVEWMTTYDLKSKGLLDQYHSVVGHGLETSETEAYEDGEERYSVHENVDDPKHHIETKVVDRYVEGVYYFKAHPDRSPETTILE